MRIRIVDAFTESAFAGNPAGVCVLRDREWPDAGWMQRVAGELRLPMTAFALSEGDGAWGLRWFTGVVEERLCGHATLATAFVLGEPGRTMRFRTLSGELTATLAGDGTVTLDFPAASVRPAAPIEGLADALGVEPFELYESVEPHDAIAVLPDEEAVRAVAPRMAALAAIQVRDALRLVAVTAAAAPGAGHDIASRVFSPDIGLDEDPVTGSVHCALAPLWAARLDREQLVARQLSARGGLMGLRLSGDRVLISGRAVVVLDGELKV